MATKNRAKLGELKSGVKDLISSGIKIVDLDDLKINKYPEENGKTFKENAKIKAGFYGNLTGLPTLADDGGLIIPYLNNEPGVRSRRWLGYEATDEELIDHTLKKLKDLPVKNRVCYLQTCVCFYHPLTKKFLCCEEKIKGHIAEKPSGRLTDGYPFRALFVVEKYNKYYDELTAKEHDEINHRLKALRKLTKSMKNLL